MPIETINFRDTQYPLLQTKGFASKFAFPFAEEICKGVGVDVGYCKPEWKLKGATGIDDGKVCFSDGREAALNVSATDFPEYKLDYIFSSHCLEHLSDWVGVLDYWGVKLKQGGVMFLYLPNADKQEYWRPMFNRKHCNWLNPSMILSYFYSREYKNIFVSGNDLNDSFYAIAEKL